VSSSIVAGSCSVRAAVSRWLDGCGLRSHARGVAQMYIAHFDVRPRSTRSRFGAETDYKNRNTKKEELWLAAKSVSLSGAHAKLAALDPDTCSYEH